MIDLQLDGRIALVTGANCGIGGAIARLLAEQGVRVFATYLKQPPGDDPSRPIAFDQHRARSADRLVDEISAAGGIATSWRADLTDPEIIPTLFDQAEAAYGGVEILLNNAAYSDQDSFSRSGDPFGRRQIHMDAASHDNHFAVNSRAVGLLIDEFARRHMARRADWGRIVSISSAGRHGFRGEVSYGASKAALESYTFSAAAELADVGVTANVVEPMATDTGWITDEMAEQIRSRSRLGHVGLPKEVADIVLFFCSHQARFLTLQRLRLQ